MMGYVSKAKILATTAYNVLLATLTLIVSCAETSNGYDVGLCLETWNVLDPVDVSRGPVKLNVIDASLQTTQHSMSTDYVIGSCQVIIDSLRSIILIAKHFSEVLRVNNYECEYELTIRSI